MNNFNLETQNSSNYLPINMIDEMSILETFVVLIGKVKKALTITRTDKVVSTTKKIKKEIEGDLRSASFNTNTIDSNGIKAPKNQMCARMYSNFDSMGGFGLDGMLE